MTYATTTELAEYLNVDEQDLPEDADKKLDKIAVLLDYHTLNKIDEDDADQAEAAKQATFYQYDWWAETGDESGLMSQFDSLSIGEFSISGGRDGMNILELAPRAKQVLFLEGLLYRGVSMQ